MGSNSTALTVNSQITDAVKVSNQAVLAPKLDDATGKVTPLGGAMAYQLVAESGALAIQDAVAHLRNITQVAEAGLASIMAQLVAAPEKILEYTPVIAAFEAVIESAAVNLSTVGANVQKAMTDYPTDKN